MAYSREELLTEDEMQEKLTKFVNGEGIEHRGDDQWVSKPFRRLDLTQNEEVYTVALLSRERKTKQVFIGVLHRTNQPSLTNPDGADITKIRWFEAQID